MSLNEQIDIARQQSMAGLDVSWMLEQWAQREPNKPCLVWAPFSGEEQTLTYLELYTQAQRLAVGLHRRGVKAGEFVLIHLDNSIEFVVSWYACAMLGTVAVSTNTHSVARDLEYFAEHTDAVCAITQPSFARLVKDACPDLRFVVVTAHDAGEVDQQNSQTCEAIGGICYADLLTNSESEVLPVLARSSSRNLSVQFTSGTTSRPKAVLWTHANGLWAGKVSAIHMRLRRDDITLVYMPLFHTNAQGYSMLATHWSGGTMVLQPKFSASRFWALCLKHRVTWVSMIPFAFKALMSHPVPDHCLRFWGVPANLPSVGQHFGVETIGWWGMTETLTHGIITDVDHPGPHGSLGRAAPEYEIQTRDASGKVARVGEKGLLFIRGVRGVSLFKEYYRNEAATDGAFDENGWFNTGDIVRSDADGWLFFGDREKDMLKVGAENVAASEIEAVIMQTGLAEECAVVAQQHFMLDEVPVAFVIPSAKGLDLAPEQLVQDIIGHCMVNLANFKVVRDVHIVTSLPRSTLEKIAKNELRARLTPITES